MMLLTAIAFRYSIAVVLVLLFQPIQLNFLDSGNDGFGLCVRQRVTEPARKSALVDTQLSSYFPLENASLFEQGFDFFVTHNVHSSLLNGVQDVLLLDNPIIRPL